MNVCIFRENTGIVSKKCFLAPIQIINETKVYAGSLKYYYFIFLIITKSMFTNRRKLNLK